MNDAKQVLLDYLLSFHDPEKAASHFAADGVFEMPYLVSVGIDPRYQGREQIQGFIASIMELYPDMRFASDDVTVLIDTPTQAFAEYVTRPTAAATGRRVDHLLMGRVVVEGGQIKLLRESLNTLAAAQALLPGGAAGVPPPSSIIRTY